MLPPPTPEPDRASTEADQRRRRQPPTERYQAQDTRRPGAEPGGKRGWFGRMRATPSNPHQSAAEQGGQSWGRGAGGETIAGYGWAESVGGINGAGRGGGGGGGGHGGRSQRQQWGGEGGSERWGQSRLRGDVVGVGLQQRQGRKDGGVLGPDSFGGQASPGAFDPYEPESQGKQGAAEAAVGGEWGKAEAADSWSPSSTGTPLAAPGKHQGATGYDPAIGGDANSSTGGGGGAEDAACTQPDGSKELIPADAATVADTLGAADGSALENETRDDLRRGWNNGEGGTSDVYIPPATADAGGGKGGAGGGGAEKAAVGGDVGEEAQQSLLGATTAGEGAAPDEGGDMESQRQPQQQQQQEQQEQREGQQQEQVLIEKDRERDKETLLATTVTSHTDLDAATKDAVKGGAGPSSDGMGEWFLPRHEVGNQNATPYLTNPTWGEQHVGGVGEREPTADPDASTVGGERTSPVGGEGAGASVIGGGGDGLLGQGQRMWGVELQPQQQPQPQQQQQQQQQQYGGEGVRHEAEGWDWADPWGQGDTWGAPGTRHTIKSVYYLERFCKQHINGVNYCKNDPTLIASINSLSPKTWGAVLLIEAYQKAA